MKFKSVMLLGVAVACGLVAMLGVQQVMSSPAETEEKSEEAQVLVATADIEPFTPLDESNTTFKSMPLKEVPAGAVLTREECAERMLRYGVVENDIILSSKLSEKNHKPSKEIPKGMRLVTVKVNQTKTHSGLIRPGDYVDVILTYKYRENNKPPVQRSQVILQNVKVFATDNRRRVSEKEGGDVNAKNMSLVVTPRDGNLVVLAESKGQLTMALRQPGEPLSEGLQPIDEHVFEQTVANKDASALARQDEPDDGTPSVKTNFGEFLNGNPTEGSLESNTSDQPQLAAKDSWKIIIFNGPDSRVEEVYATGQEENSSTRRQSPGTNSRKSTRKPASRKTTSSAPRKDSTRRKRSQPTKPASI